MESNLRKRKPLGPFGKANCDTSLRNTGQANTSAHFPEIASGFACVKAPWGPFPCHRGESPTVRTCVEWTHSTYCHRRRMACQPAQCADNPAAGRPAVGSPVADSLAADSLTAYVEYCCARFLISCAQPTASFHCTTAPTSTP